MARSIMDAVAEAKASVPDISPQDAAELHGQDNVVFVDVRDAPEVAASGKVAGAVNISRGMLEFKADPSTPMHDPVLSPDKTVVLYCGTGGRAALSGKALQDLGYTDVRNLGGFDGWASAGLPTD